MRLILGSQSPRRKEILSYFALPFVQISSDYPEETVSFAGNPSDYVIELSAKKGQTLVHRFPEDVILTADTVVYWDGKIFNKPNDAQEAFSMLRCFSGTWHEIYTAVSVLKGNALYSGFEKTKIQFNPLSDEQILQYLRSSAFLDKAGGYAIQGAGSILVARMEGCYYNVIGLPINTTRDLLLKVGIDLWKYLSP